MLNKENYVPWSSRLLCYAKSRPNGKLIHNSIINSPYVRRMIPEPEADDQAIQTILLGLPEDIYAAVDSCKTAQEIWLRVQQMMKGSDNGIQEKKAKLFNEWERFTSNKGESIESYYHLFLKLMNDLKLNKHFPKKIASNLKFLNNLQPEWSRHVTIVHQTKDLHTADYTQLYDFLKYNQKGNGLIGVPGNANLNGNGNLVAARAEGNAAGHNGNQIRCYNCRVEGHFARNCTVRPRRRDAAYLQTQLLIAHKEEAGIQLQAEEFDLMAATADLDEIKEVNANCVLMANLHQEKYDKLERCYQQSVYQEQCLSKKINALHLSTDKQIMSLNEQISDINKQLSKEKSTVSFLLEEKKKLTSDFKTREDELLDKQIQLEKKLKELNNILVKTGQSIQMIHMLSPKPDLFYHIEQKIALGYKTSFYLKQAQKKQQSLYDGKVLLEKHDPPVVYDSEETLQLAQESREKMKQLNKEIKPANYTKINHLSGVFVSQTAKSRKELYFLNDSKTVNVSKSISIPNEDFSDYTTPSVARKFLNEVKTTIVTLQRVVKHRMTLETHNWSSSTHQELYKIVKVEIFPIVNQVDARVQNFEIQFLKEAAKFVRDFKSLAKEADESLAKHKTLELEIKRLLRAVNTIYENAKLRAQLFNKVSDQKDNKRGTSTNTKFAKQSIVKNLPKVDEIHALSKPVTLNSVPMPQESKVMKKDKVIALGMFDNLIISIT
nr:hypothetical protein [Tanacetum cinerariifolium]